MRKVAGAAGVLLQEFVRAFSGCYRWSPGRRAARVSRKRSRRGSPRYAMPLAARVGAVTGSGTATTGLSRNYSSRRKKSIFSREYGTGMAVRLGDGRRDAEPLGFRGSAAGEGVHGMRCPWWLASAPSQDPASPPPDLGRNYSSRRKKRSFPREYRTGMAEL